MRTAVISFTERGAELSRHLKEQMEKKEYCEAALYTKYSGPMDWGEDICFVEEALKEWTGKQFLEKEALIFIGACGIAVRSIAPHLKDKLNDIPVLVIDEGGSYVIPVLSGHYGGGNELAVLAAEQLGATAVITTATDVNGLFAVDVFAKKNGLTIGEKNGIAKVSSKILTGRQITFQVDGGEIKGELPPEIELLTEETSADVIISVKNDTEALLHLYPKAIILGMGCKKGKTCEEIEAFVLEQLEQLHIPICAVRALATIDRKGKEPGFLEFAEKYGISFLTYSKETLEAIAGEFSASVFVKNQVGVDNVCERAAAAAAEENSRREEKRTAGERKSMSAAEHKAEDTVKILLRKTARDGMTLAVAGENWSVAFENSKSKEGVKKNDARGKDET